MNITKTYNEQGNPIFTTGKVVATLYPYVKEIEEALGNVSNVDGRYGMIARIDGGMTTPIYLDANEDNIEGFLRDFRAAELTLISAKSDIVDNVRGFWTDLQTSDTDAVYKIGRIKEGQSLKIKSDLNLWALYWLGIDTEHKSDFDDMYKDDYDVFA